MCGLFQIEGLVRDGLLESGKVGLGGFLASLQAGDFFAIYIQPHDDP
ncbi:MAG: hypothetical protein WC120_01675 [Parcubacteria group bacterium]